MFLLRCQWVSWGCTRIWEGSQLETSWPQLDKGIFHTIKHHAELSSWGELSGELSHGWGRLSSGWWAIAMCITCFVYCLLVITNTFLSFFVLLNCLHLNSVVLPFSYSLPHLWWTEWLNGSSVFSCLKLNHSKGISKFYVKKRILSNIQHQVGLLKRLWSCKSPVKQMSVVNILRHYITGIHLA